MKNNFRILIVEDEESYREIYEQWLQGDGREIIKTASTEEALRIVDKFPPDAVILDIGLPEADGIEFLRQIFQDKQVPDIPVFIVSGCGELSTRLSGFIKGARRYFIKPVDREDLTHCIDNAENKARPENREKGKPSTLRSIP